MITGDAVNNELEDLDCMREVQIDHVLRDVSRLGPHVIRTITTKHELPEEAIKILFDFIKTSPLTAKSCSIINELMSDLRDINPSTYSHCIRVGWYSLEAAKAQGLDDELCRSAMLCGLLHDIGKMGTLRSIIQKKGKLTPIENALIQDHPVTSGRYLDLVEDFPQELKEAVISHHEKINGLGYPNKRKGDELDTITRILTIADIYDAITSNRPYKDACTPAECFSIMRDLVVKQELDRSIFNTFSKHIDMILIGTDKDAIGTILHNVNLRIIGLDYATQSPICQILTHESDKTTHDINR